MHPALFVHRPVAGTLHSGTQRQSIKDSEVWNRGVLWGGWCNCPCSPRGGPGQHRRLWPGRPSSMHPCAVPHPCPALERAKQRAENRGAIFNSCSTPASGVCSWPLAPHCVTTGIEVRVGPGRRPRPVTHHPLQSSNTKLTNCRNAEGSKRSQYARGAAQLLKGLSVGLADVSFLSSLGQGAGKVGRGRFCGFDVTFSPVSVSLCLAPSC